MRSLLTATRVSFARRFTAAATAYSLLLQLIVANGIAVAASAQTPPPAAPHGVAAAASYGIVLKAVTTEFDAISGIAAYEPANEPS